jgi:lysyl-tRNA synthetase class 2
MEPKKPTDQVQDSLGHVSQEHEIRVEKVKKLQEQGINPWPAVKIPSAQAHNLIANFSESDTTVYTIVGRLMTKRLHGKAAFAHVQDQSGKIQIYIKEDLVGASNFSLFEHSIDIGDVLWVQGALFKTKVGEISLRADAFSLQSKCLHPLPEKFHGLHDVEVRYRQRYLDLICNEASKKLLIDRSRIVQAVREFFTAQGYLEVETPMLHPIAGGAQAKPFVTHHNALGQDFFLRIAPELYLKRLVVGGLDRVFEINRNFRNEGISTKHNPEFSMLECYTAHQTVDYAMELIESVFKSAIKSVGLSQQVQFGDHVIDFSKKFERIGLYDAVKKQHNLSDADLNEEKIDALLKQHRVKLTKSDMSLAEKIYLLFAETVEKTLIAPTFVTGFPVEVSPLAKRDGKDSEIAARAELFIAGLELANLFDELNDPFDQAQRFTQQVQAKASGDAEAHEYDADYILALEHALPPTVGFGIGIDRMVMILTGTTSIKDVILFPTLKKK